MKEQKTSFIERLKVCWNALTKDNYIFFGVNDDMAVFDEKTDEYTHLKKGSVSAFSYVTYDVKYMSKGEVINLHDFVWKCVEKWAKEAQIGKY